MLYVVCLFRFFGGFKMARPTKYDKEVKPHIEEVREAVANGATTKEIADALGIAESTVYEYKKKYKEFSDAFTRGRAQICVDIRAALLKKALGFHYEEKKVYMNKDGQPQTEIFQRYCQPSETAGAMLLRNYDKEWLDKDSVTTELKRQEMELKKAIADDNSFNGLKGV